MVASAAVLIEVTVVAVAVVNRTVAVVAEAAVV